MQDDHAAPRASWLPLLKVLQNYPRAWLADDVLAGLSACVVMIPSVLTLMAGVIAQLPIVALGTTDLQAR